MFDVYCSANHSLYVSKLITSLEVISSVLNCWAKQLVMYVAQTKTIYVHPRYSNATSYNGPSPRSADGCGAVICSYMGKCWSPCICTWYNKKGMGHRQFLYDCDTAGFS